MKNFKKVLALVLVLATLLGLATMASATEYKDADKISADYTEAVKVLDLIETMQGYPNGEFKPTANITREEAAKLIAIFDNKDADISTYYTSINPFADEKGRWGESYVGYGYRAGIIAGMNATTFAPTANVTGTQFLKMALVTLGYDQEAEGFVGSSWAVNVLSLARKLDLIDGLADGWKAEAALTREEAAQILLNTLKADTVEYAQEAKQVGFKPAAKLNGTEMTYTWNGRIYLTVAGAVKTGDKLYKDFDLKVTTSYDAFYRPYTKWTKGDNSVEIMEAPKATFTTKFNACDLLAELGVKKTDTDKEVVIDYVINNGVANDQDPLMRGNKYVGSSYKLSEKYTARPAGMEHLSHDTMIMDDEFGIWSHTYSNCALENYEHGAQGTLTQVFYNGKDSAGNKHYYVVSIDTWLAKVGTVTKKTTARDEHLRSEGSVKFAAVYNWNTTQSNELHGGAHGFLEAYCTESSASTGRFWLDGQCAKLNNSITYDDPTGLAKDDYVLITYSFKAKGNGYEGVQSAEVVEGKEGRLTGWVNELAGADPTSTRIDSEYVKDAVHFHLGYGLSKTNKYDTYTFFYDAYGNVIGMTDAKDTSSWGVLDGAYITYDKGNAALNVEVVGLDAKISEGTAKKAWGVSKFDGMTAADIISNDLLNGTGDPNSRAWDGENRKAFRPAYDHLFKITTDSEGVYTIATSTDVENLNNLESVKITNKKPYIEGETGNGVYDELEDLRMTSDTKILVHKMDGTYASYTGYKNVDSLIAHHAEYVLSDDGKTIDVLYLCDNVYMTDGKFTAFVGKGLKNKALEMNDETYWALTVYVNGAADTVYLNDKDAHEFQPDNGKYVQGFYEMQYVEVDGVKTVKILKGPAGSAYTQIDEDLAWTKTIYDITEEWVATYKNGANPAKRVTVNLAADCAFYLIEDDKTEVLEKVDYATFEDACNFSNDQSMVNGVNRKAYISYNSDGDVNALYLVVEYNW